MRGWMCKDKYVFEFLHTFFRLQFIKKKKMPKKMHTKLYQIKILKNLYFIFEMVKKEKVYFSTLQ